MTKKNLDEIRESTLATVERSEKRVKQLIGLASVIEGALLVTFLVLMDMGERLHWLLLVASLLVYGTLGAGLLTLGAHNNVNTNRILKAIALRDDEDEAARA